MVISHQALGKNMAQLRLECGRAREIDQLGRNAQIPELLSLFWKQRHLICWKPALQTSYGTTRRTAFCSGPLLARTGLHKDLLGEFQLADVARDRAKGWRRRRSWCCR